MTETEQEKYERWTCPRCGSMKTQLYEDKANKTDVWKATLRCGNCHHPIFEWGL